MMKRIHVLLILSLLGALSLGCGGTAPHGEHGQGLATGGDSTEPSGQPARPPESPPASGPARDVQFPEINRTQTQSGLEVNTVQFGHLPLVYLRLVIRSGNSNDPADMPGLARFAANMLKEGTRSRTSAELAEEIEFLGADLSVGADQENTYIMVRALSEHLDQAMELLADVALHPRFDNDELSRLKRRELTRLTLSSQQPRYLARRAFYQGLYGEHPYARTDTTEEAVEAIGQRDLQSWHRQHVVPNNAFLVAVGNVDPQVVQDTASRHFRSWRSRRVTDVSHAAPPERSQREVIVVDRPQSVQSVIYVGNLALNRNNPDYVRLEVANQVLGGSAASRLFMDLREARSLTYGAYSGIVEMSEVAPFIAYAAVRNEVTEEAMSAFMEHLDRIVEEAPSTEEVTNAQRFLSDSFPLQIETASRIASMVQQLRIFELGDDYWDNYRTSIREVTPAQAHASAGQYIHPDTALIVAVGRAADIVEPLRAYGPVRVVNTDGEEIQTFEATD